MNNVVLAEPVSVQISARSSSDRRRPGRVPYQSNELIELLRDPAVSKVGLAANALPVEAGYIAPADDALRAARGIITGVLLSLGCWSAIGAAIWLLCRG